MRGRELKFADLVIRYARQLVRPHARAGVEIGAHRATGIIPWFALMRGRELKSANWPSMALDAAFALMRGRELKSLV